MGTEKKTEFKSYNSIENSYNSKIIARHLGYNPELATIGYVAREKLDGANIQLVFEPNSEVVPAKVGKRSSFLAPMEPFFDIWVTLDKYKSELQRLQNTANHENVTLRVFGEIYGPGINKRINYGPEKKIAFFDVYKDDMLMSQMELEAFFFNADLLHMLPPLIGHCVPSGDRPLLTSLEEALKISEVFDSKVLNIENNASEGVVIQPFQRVIRSPNGERFILKKKSEKFEEKMKVKGNEHKKEEQYSPEAFALRSKFLEYINDNRVLSAFSKHGPMQEMKQIGNYIRIILDDAKTDFLKDNEGLVLKDDETKFVFNVGHEIVTLLKKHL